MQLPDINNFFGDMDLMLMDALLRGIVPYPGPVLDAGCGAGRNLLYFLQQGYEVSAIDRSASDVQLVNYLCRSLGKAECAAEGLLENMPYAEGSFGFVMCARVLHFAKTEAHFWAMMNELRRVAAPQAVLYLVMDSLMGMESKVQAVDRDHWQFPDGSLRFLLTEQLQSDLLKNWEPLVDPRTVIYDGKHGETTLLLRKKQARA